MRGRRGLPCDIEESPCQKLTLIAVPKAGYRFDHWVLDGETSEYQVVTISTDRQFQVNKDVDLTVKTVVDVRC